MATDNATNITAPISMEEITAGDCAWILSNSFLILTMQSGFGLLEAGFVSTKNIANIMVKNVVDVCLGGITYWSFGYGLSFGSPSNWFCGYGDFFAEANDYNTMGTFYTRYVFQFSFATAATTIVSGAIAERMKLSAYIWFSVLNTFVYVFPASWAWNGTGFLAKMGFHDFAGACVVHLTGGASALIAAIMLGPRIGRFEPGGDDRYSMSSPVTALTGTFMLWWAWLAFNCGSTFGIENDTWKLAAKVGINTLNGSIGGGIIGIVWGLASSRGRIYDVGTIITGVLGGLVGVTAGCGVFSPLASLIMGAVGSLTACFLTWLLVKLHVDDPVGAVPVHYGAALVGTLGVGLFGSDPHFGQLGDNKGIFVGGTFHQLGIQVLGVTLMSAWSMIMTVAIFILFKFTINPRMSEEHELMGADWVEHDARHESFMIKFEQAFATTISGHPKGSEMSDVDRMIQTMIDHLIDMANRDMHGPRHIPNHMSNATHVAAIRESIAAVAAEEGLDAKAVQRPKSVTVKHHRAETPLKAWHDADENKPATVKIVNNHSIVPR